MLAGFGNANIGTAQAIIADVTTLKIDLRNALIGVASGLGFYSSCLGGFFSTVLSSNAIYRCWYSLLNLFAFFMLEETKSKDLSQRKKII